MYIAIGAMLRIFLGSIILSEVDVFFCSLLTKESSSHVTEPSYLKIDVHLLLANLNACQSMEEECINFGYGWALFCQYQFDHLTVNFEGSKMLMTISCMLILNKSTGVYITVKLELASIQEKQVCTAMDLIN